MFDTIAIYFTLYAKAVAANPILAGFALYFTGVTTYLVRNIPIKMWNALVHMTTTSVEMNNAGYSGNEDQYNGFLTWYMTSRWSKWSRRLYTGQGYDKKGTRRTIVGPGTGNHFFFYKNKFFWFHKALEPSSGSDRQKESITVHTFGRQHKPLLDMINEFRYQEQEADLSIYNFSKEWYRFTSIKKRSLNTVCIDKDIKAHAVATIERFVERPEWFLEKGLAHKIIYLLEGEPGTGKSTLVKALASHFNRSICIMDLSVMNNGLLQFAFSTLPKDALLLIEDVDAATKVVESREAPPPKPSVSHDAVAPSLSLDLGSMGGLTLAGLLNALDGIIPLDDAIVFMTTNHLEKLDKALIRKSRVDHIYHIGAMKNEQIHDYIALMYPEAHISPTVVFDDMIGCDVQAAFMEAPESIEDFLKQVPHHNSTPALVEMGSRH